MENLNKNSIIIPTKDLLEEMCKEGGDKNYRLYYSKYILKDNKHNPVYAGYEGTFFSNHGTVIIKTLIKFDQTMIYIETWDAILFGNIQKIVEYLGESVYYSNEEE